MRTVIVDDEPLARKELRRLLSVHPWVEIVGEAADVDEAEERIRQLSPELLFLDVHIPGGTGFDVLARLEDAPMVVFTTAYDHYAVRAFEVNALDYLLKPIDPDRLAAALVRVRGRAPEAPTSDRDGPRDRIFVRDGARCWFVPLGEVRLVSAEGNFVKLHWGELTPLVARSLVAFEAKLDPTKFFRANRAEIVNLDFVDAVEAGEGGRLYVRLKGGQEIEISRRQARLFRSRMGA